MTAPGATSTDGVDSAVAPLAESDNPALVDIETSEPLSPVPKVSSVDVEKLQLQTYGIIIASVVICAALGSVAGPLLAGPMESLTGTPVDNTSDLRPTGCVLGLLAGFLVGATSGWIIWSGR